MKGAVWAYDYESGLEQLKQIKINYEFMRIKSTRERFSRFGSFIDFENGDTWKMVLAHDSARGNRINVSYIDRRISGEFIQGIIRNCTTAQPFQAFRYYGPYPEEEVENRWIIS